MHTPTQETKKRKQKKKDSQNSGGQNKSCLGGERGLMGKIRQESKIIPN